MRVSSVNQRIINQSAKKQVYLKTNTQKKQSNYENHKNTANSNAMNFCGNATKLTDKLTKYLNNEQFIKNIQRILATLILACGIGKILENKTILFKQKTKSQAMTGHYQAKPLSNTLEYHQG